MVASADSTLLFAAFAQWFTDSFLRTEHGFTFKQDGNPELDPVSGRPIRSNNRHVRNTSNHEIDLCQIYGLDEDRTTMLRTSNTHDYRGYLEFQLLNGEMFPPFLLKSPAEPGLPLQVREKFIGLHHEPHLRLILEGIDKAGVRSDKIFAVGLEHGNSTLGNSVLNTIFLREHNRVAELIGRDNPNWDDERVFQTTRNVLIAILLKVVISDYVPHLAPGDLPLEVIPGLADKQRWYRPNWIAIEFNLLYRWHEMIPDHFAFLSNASDYRHNNGALLDNGVEWLVEGLSLQAAGKIVLGNHPEWLKSALSDTLVLMRSSGLPRYADYRRQLGLKIPESFGEVTKNVELARKLSEAYSGRIENLEWFIGMYAEEHFEGAALGETMLVMVAHDAITQALTNPILADGVYGENTFSKVGKQELDCTHTLADVIRRNVSRNDICCGFSRAKTGPR